MKFPGVVLSVILAMIPTGVRASAIYTFEIFDVPGSRHTLPQGINDAGEIVGYAVNAAGKSMGFVRDGTTYTFPRVFDTFDTVPMGLNDAGQITGFYWSEDPSLGNSGFVKDGDFYTVFNAPGAWETRAYGINDAGKIVGSYYDDAGVHPYLKDGDSYSIIAFPGAISSGPSAINDEDTIVGSYSDSHFVRHGFIKRGAEYSSLDLLNEATGLNDSGLIVGYAGSFGYVTDGVHSARFSVPGANAFPTGINDAGLIVGSFVDREWRIRGFIATPTDAWAWDPPPPPPSPVPEPTVLLLWGSALAMLAGQAWRRRRA